MCFTKYSLVIISLLFLINAGLWAQDKNRNTGRIQLDIGVSNSYLFNSDAVYRYLNCVEGCSLEGRSPRLVPNISLGYYHIITERSELVLGLGYSEISHVEEWKTLFLVAYFDEIFEALFLNLFTGYRHNLYKSENVNLFVENQISMDYLLEERTSSFDSGSILDKINFSYKLKIGTLVKLSDVFNLSIDGFFKTAITDYIDPSKSNLIFNQYESYYPFNYGLEIGIGVRL